MLVNPITDGIVLDHITAGKGMELYKILRLSELECAVAIITNANSVKMGKKDIIKIDGEVALDLDVIAYVDPGVTVNIIRDGKVIESGAQPLTIKALSYASLGEIDFQKTDVRNHYLAFSFSVNGEVVSSGTVLFTKPKHFRFIDPKLRVEVVDDEIIVKADAFAKYVFIYNENDDLILSDNFFDMHKGEKRIKILSGEAKNLQVKTVFDIK